MSQYPSATALPPEWQQYLESLFSFRMLTVRQKVLAITPKYHVYDESGAPRFYVVREGKFGLMTVSGLAAMAVNVMALIIGIRYLMAGDTFMGLGFFIVGGWAASLLRRILMPFRDVHVYTDESQQVRLMTIRQDNRFGLYQWFTLFDIMGCEIARCRRSTISGLWRRWWKAETKDGREIVTIREDNLGLALLRRYLGPLWGALRTNFDFILPNGARIGEYNRKLTVTDQYVLNLAEDPAYLVDRRVALALGILLDTGEGR